MRPTANARRGTTALLATSILALFSGCLGNVGAVPEGPRAEGSVPDGTEVDPASVDTSRDDTSQDDPTFGVDTSRVDGVGTERPTDGVVGSEHRSTPRSNAPGSGDERAYLLGADDVLTITVAEESELTGDFTIATDGTILYAYAGRIEAAGSTVAELERRLGDLLGEEYLQRRPQVTVEVKEYRSQKVRILGDVGKPGAYPLRGPMRLSELLDLAEGVTGQLHNPARRRRAQVWIPSSDRDHTPTAPTVEVDLYALLVERRSELDLLLTAGSVVFVPEAAEERPTVVVLGEVHDPGPVFHEPGLTVLEAVSRAGGPTSRAARKKRALVVNVQRLREGEIVEVRVGMNDVLEAGDILSLPVSFW